MYHHTNWLQFTTKLPEFLREHIFSYFDPDDIWSLAQSLKFPEVRNYLVSLPHLWNSVTLTVRPYSSGYGFECLDERTVENVSSVLNLLEKHVGDLVKTINFNIKVQFETDNDLRGNLNLDSDSLTKFHQLFQKHADFLSKTVREVEFIFEVNITERDHNSGTDHGLHPGRIPGLHQETAKFHSVELLKFINSLKQLSKFELICCEYTQIFQSLEEVTCLAAVLSKKSMLKSLVLQGTQG